MLPIALLLCLLSGVHADCFIEHLSPGKRDMVARTSAVDDFHCKILCFLNEQCLAYMFDEGVKGCAQLGPVSGLTCTLPTQEQLRKTSNCPKIDVASAVNGSYVQNPAIDSSTMLPIKNTTYNKNIPYNIPCGVGWNVIDLLLPDLSHRVVASYYAVTIAWNGELGAWTYKDHLAIPIIIRGAACFSVPLADAHALAEDACAPLSNLRTPGYGPPSAPFNRSWPCDDNRATEVQYLSAGANELVASKNQALINCVYGSWLYLQTYEGYKQTRGIVTATCV